MSTRKRVQGPPQLRVIRPDEESSNDPSAPQNDGPGSDTPELFGSEFTPFAANAPRPRPAPIRSDRSSAGSVVASADEGRGMNSGFGSVTSRPDSGQRSMLSANSRNATAS